MSKRVCGGASIGGSIRVLKIFDLVSHNATVTGEWYIPGHLWVSSAEFEFSNGLGKCEYTETKFEGEKVGSIELGDLGMFCFSLRQFCETGGSGFGDESMYMLDAPSFKDNIFKDV